MNFTIQSKLNPEHLKTAFTLLQSTHWGKRITDKKFKLQNQNTKTYGIFYGKTMIGFFRLMTDGAFLCYLMDLVIDPEYRNQGAATKALHYIEKKHAGFKILIKSSEAQELYLGNNYSPIKKTDNYFVKTVERP